MNSNPGKSPSSSEIIIKLNEWLNIIGGEAENKLKAFNKDKKLNNIKKGKSLNIAKSEVENKMKRQFLESDEINEKLPIIKKNIKESKPYNIIDINKSLSKLKTSKTAVNIEVSDDQLTLCIYLEIKFYI
ncbi:hypothetical protein C2G38_2158586 [Gigaspora rosea]|uniref:Uncharacterized protein n=1 Tax=Gigaspora rosea TaxID=44941 RepID=A0A397W1T9_9GLOM|nr:hypothetical protein C2G38_2158586 [Gigaspora rosea]